MLLAEGQNSEIDRGSGLSEGPQTTNETTQPGDRGNQVDAETRELRPGDSVRYRIDEDPHASSEPLRAYVNAAGDIHFMVSRRKDTYVTVNTRGKRLIDIRNDFKTKLDADYYHAATVTVDLDNIDRTPGALNASSAKVTFFGEVRGMVPLPDDQELMLSEAMLQLAIPDFADLRKVEIQRFDPDTQRTITKEVNVQNILNKGQRDLDVALQDGDRVRVPARRFTF